MNRSVSGAQRASRTWIELEAAELIELKRIALDKDAVGAASFFEEVVVPKVRAAAERQGMRVPNDKGAGRERLPG
jgi:hypothetical protein